MHNFGISNSQQTFNRQVSSYKRDTEFQFLCYANIARVLFLFAYYKIYRQRLRFLKLFYPQVLYDHIETASNVVILYFDINNVCSLQQPRCK